MAVKTMAKNTDTGQYNAGWHELTIKSATDGTWTYSQGNDKRIIDLAFENYPEHMSHRVFETVNKTTNEEFKIANLFRYACAGIIDVLNDPTGKKPVIQYDDEVSNLVGTRINALFFKETNSTTGKEYSKIFDIVPVAQVTDHITWTEDDVSRLKSKAESRYKKNNSPSNVDLGTVNIDTTTTSTNDEIPF